MYVYQGMIFNEFYQTTCYRMSIVVCFIYNEKVSVGLNYWATGTGMGTGTGSLFVLSLHC